ncbi:uncharacterized protein LOC130992004 [Salvia miltiorrhiza]|uniref:uncharacterized protein LOC130992004 n=1 Tax=Salvia miltiorrhiza TaxID=226208 RepID=UPI0025AC7AC7|nr:uncharacterized protein LOC130992004 [Salvia miltiorrhiza]
MVLNAYDAKVCVWKMIKISTKTCVDVSKKHPYVTSCFLFMFLLYMCCPLFFWILIYSLPPAISTWVVLSIRDDRRCRREREKEREQKERESGGKMVKKTMFAEEAKAKGRERMKKAYLRVHSVRRRKAKEIERGYDWCLQGKRSEAEDEDEDEEEYEESNNRDVVDKEAIVEEIRQDQPPASADISVSCEIYRNPEVVRSLRQLKDEEEEASSKAAMDVNIAEAERNERLESLIARRRSKKVVSSAVSNRMPPPNIVIPKVSSWCSPSRPVAPSSPGSAPSMLGPTRNPFDLPYDPQEEKPDLTGDSFQQEFASGHGRDFTFCRHESFSLGPSLPMDFFEDRDDASSIDDFGFRRRRSSIGYHHFPKPETEESDTDFGGTTEAESDSKSNIESDHPDNDEIKEVIQVHENQGLGGGGGEAKTRANNALDELSLSEASEGSSEDDRPPVCKINREAILKSLSMRRNSVSVPDIEMESNDQLQENNLSYANSALENASRLKQQYFADKPQKRHGMTFSIASDMQVEVSELSSPPLTIGENMSYQDDADGEMERNASWDGLDSWAGSSRLSEAEDNETRLPRPNEARSKKCESTSRPSDASTKITAETTATSPESSSDEDSSEEQSPAAETAASNEGVQRVEGEGSTAPPQQPTISPKSVLQPTLSVASFEHEDREEVRAAEHSRASAVQFTVGTTSNGAAAAESSQRNKDEKQKQVVDGSTSETRQESSSSTSLSSDVESSDMDYMNDDAMIQQINARLSTNQPTLSSNQIDKGKMAIEESTQSETSSCEDYDSEVEDGMNHGAQQQ